VICPAEYKNLPDNNPTDREYPKSAIPSKLPKNGVKNPQFPKSPAIIELSLEIVTWVKYPQDLHNMIFPQMQQTETGAKSPC
jgi:hypothetical protein